LFTVTHTCLCHQAV